MTGRVRAGLLVPVALMIGLFAGCRGEDSTGGDSTGSELGGVIDEVERTVGAVESEVARDGG